MLNLTTEEKHDIANSLVIVALTLETKSTDPDRDMTAGRLRDLADRINRA